MAASFRGGLPLFSFKGIKVLVHWSFLALPAFIAFNGYSEGLGTREVLMQLGLVLIVFACVVLHEFGHALTALRFGVRTRDITLLPIGGVASLERMPEDPKQEFWITAAGPLVNLVIAGLAFGLMALLGLSWLLTDLDLGVASWTAVLGFVLSANLMLFLFNLIPAFPMDGGRILRSLLSMRMPRERATRIAAGLGRILAVGFVVYGVYASLPFTALIGVFIFMAAGAEARQVVQQTALSGATVGEVMRTRFWTIPAPTPVHEAVNGLLAGGDHVAVVVDVMGYVGVVDRKELWTAVGEGKKDHTLRQFKLRVPPIVSPDADAETTYKLMILGGHPLLPVMDQGTLVGIFEADNLNEFIRIRQANAQAQQAIDH